MSAVETTLPCPARAEAPPEVSGEAARALRWAATTIAVTTVLLLVFNSASLRDWADGLAPSETSQTIRAAADGWADRMDGLGLSAPRAAVHRSWKAAVAATF